MRSPVELAALVLDLTARQRGGERVELSWSELEELVGLRRLEEVTGARSELVEVLAVLGWRHEITTVGVALVPPWAVTAPARAVFDYWRERLGHPAAKFVGKRLRAVQGRLREGYTVEQLKRAVDGISRSAWHMGENADGRRWDDLGLICRDGEHVERFMREAGLDAREASGAKDAMEAPSAFDLALERALNRGALGEGRTRTVARRRRRDE